MSAAGQILYLKIEQNCIVYKRSVTLQDIASVECTDVGILRQVLQEQVYYFSGNEKSSLVQVFSVLDVIRKIHEKYPMLEVENICDSLCAGSGEKIRAIFKDSVGLRDSVFRFRIYHHDIYRGCFCQ